MVRYRFSISLILRCFRFTALVVIEQRHLSRVELLFNIRRLCSVSKIENDPSVLEKAGKVTAEAMKVTLAAFNVYKTRAGHYWLLVRFFTLLVHTC